MNEAPMEESTPAPADEVSLVPLAEEVGTALKRAGLVAAMAESCTGGLVGHLITEVPGSSAWFAGSAVVYSYAAKERLLGVDPDALLREGAVSFVVAQQMAHGARARYAADVAVAVTGIAGPGGGTAEKPVGLVHFHLAAANGDDQAQRIVWRGDRRSNKLLSAQFALRMLLAYVQRRE